MLPGFRFLLAAILLSTSILVFGLGAAALLRATHEQYVSNPSWRNGPQEQVFAQAPEPAQPVLAALRAEPEVVAEPLASQPEPSLRDLIPTIGLPLSEPEQVVTATIEADVPPVPTAPMADAIAAEPAQIEMKTETETKTETTTEAEARPPADTLTPADTTASILEAKPAAIAIEPAPAADPGFTQASSAPDIAATNVAALNAPATTAKAKVESNKPDTNKAESGKPEGKAAKPRAQRAKKHRRIVRRPPPPQQLQQSFDPFGQQQTLATMATRPRP